MNSYLKFDIGRQLKDQGHVSVVTDLSTDPAEMLCVARESKLSILFFRANGELSKAKKRTSSVFNFNAERDREVLQTLQTNARVLHLAHLAAQALNDAQIKFVFYKGPLQQKCLYGDFFAKPSNDIDILVSKRDFIRAKDALVGIRFQLPEECRRLWWRLFLGEQHLFLDGNNRNSVDLHCKVQQPGSPAPRYTERLLEAPQMIELGSTRVPVLALHNIAVIAALNLVKGMFHQDPVGSHALDLLVSLRQMTPPQLEDLRKEAQVQGLWGTLRLASRVAAITFSEPDRFCKDDLDLPFPEENIADLVFKPRAAQSSFPHRRVILWHLCDFRLKEYIIEAGRYIISEFVRIIRL